MSSEKRTLIDNALLLNEGQEREVAILIGKDGRIERVESAGGISPAPTDTAIDAQGDYLMPGAIDTHVHFRDPGLTHKADMATESAAAVSGGVTSFLDMPNTKPLTTNNQALREKYQYANGRSYANYGFYLGATRRNIEEIEALDPTITPAVKLFMGSSTGDMAVDQLEALHSVFSQTPILLATHCETDDLIRANTQLAKQAYPDGDIPYHLHPQIRSAHSCAQSVSLAMELAQQYNTRLHILHLSCAEELDLIAQGKEKRPGYLTAETCPHYLHLSSTSYDQLRWRMKCNPAIKGRMDQLHLQEALHSGLIDTIGSDHAPHLISEKDRPYASAPSGMPSIEFSLQLMLDLADTIGLPRHHIPRLMAHNPATIYRIHLRGYVREGYYADLVRVRHLQEPQSLTQKGIRTKCAWTPYVNHTTRYSVIATWVNGHLAYSPDSPMPSPQGKALRFNHA
ncbi:MAG: dihydroorotase [Bacteroidetes bacterium]|nr:MAG: dihydroorotase [Bacteroidota bacterium]